MASGRRLEIPEADRGRWFSIEEARQYIREEQRSLLDNLYALSHRGLMWRSLP